mmetsp:Transcript_11532/g.19677  ORF Transcript_11532/g.19677 Transcript_11532/m.19677 type:complete len:781 (+) Transcript_11532:274-2616(+)|eukprot:CAMPEP_0198197606 /NCGR_PEP_ID=MMETSP1445-20131203/1164_1 /TAXON_ID=36898 /ORGANISM="Pyramimonas sp., Strain CCMP2087" /LENGTH=780 /DNA_ID=CAMNT_0043866927 /DNA_START=220 /DNA_END=2562 /DNA_ORIENTATION=-
MSSSHTSESASPGRREESEGAPTSNRRFKQVVRLADLLLKKEKTKKTCPASINEQITLMQTGQAESVNVPYHVLESVRSWFGDTNKPIYPELSYKEKIDLADIFSAMDENNCGEIGVKELMKAFQMMGNSYNDACKQVKKLLVEADLDCNGSVSMHEFEMIVRKSKQKKYQLSLSDGVNDPRNSKGKKPLIELPFEMVALTYRRKKLLEGMMTRDADMMQRLRDKFNKLDALKARTAKDIWIQNIKIRKAKRLKAAKVAKAAEDAKDAKEVEAADVVAEKGRKNWKKAEKAVRKNILESNESMKRRVAGTDKWKVLKSVTRLALSSGDLDLQREVLAGLKVKMSLQAAQEHSDPAKKSKLPAGKTLYSSLSMRRAELSPDIFRDIQNASQSEIQEIRSRSFSLANPFSNFSKLIDGLQAEKSQSSERHSSISLSETNQDKVSSIRELIQESETNQEVTKLRQSPEHSSPTSEGVSNQERETSHEGEAELRGCDGDSVDESTGSPEEPGADDDRMESPPNGHLPPLDASGRPAQRGTPISQSSLQLPNITSASPIYSTPAKSRGEDSDQVGASGRRASIPSDFRASEPTPTFDWLKKGGRRSSVGGRAKTVSFKLEDPRSKDPRDMMSARLKKKVTERRKDSECRDLYSHPERRVGEGVEAHADRIRKRAEEMARLKERAMHALEEGGEGLEEEHHAALQPFGYKQGGHWTAEVRPQSRYKYLVPNHAFLQEEFSHREPMNRVQVRRHTQRLIEASLTAPSKLSQQVRLIAMQHVQRNAPI